jgi:hypothetical protein
MKPIASLSLDLDNKWSYMKTHGDAGWEQYPSYFDLLVPRTLDLLKRHGLTITYFVVGQDAVLAKNAAALKSIADAGHEIGNHSFKHEPWLHLYSDREIDTELRSAQEAIEKVTGCRPTGFRGPGFSCSQETLATLKRMGYAYDASTFPTFLGPLGRLYYFMHSSLSKAELKTRKQLFGKFTEGFRPLKPYRWRTDAGELIEIPVTTMPIFKVPIHASYILYLSCYSELLAMAYLRTALWLCKVTGVQPSILLHPLDFLGGDDEKDLSFFPAMNLPGAKKMAIMDRILTLLTAQYQVVPMRDHAKRIEQMPKLRSSVPNFPTAAATV